MNYKTYAEAKIANPDSEIVTTGKNWDGDAGIAGIFEALVLDEFDDSNGDGAHEICDESWAICNPADHCSSIKEFLEAGFKFSVGDLFTSTDGCLGEISGRSAKESEIKSNDDKRHILSAAALSGGCKIPAKAEKWTVYNNTLPLCELTDEQVGKLVKHSGCVEHMNPNSGEWVATITPMWNRARVYRITPKSERELFIKNSSRIMHSVEGDGLINDITIGALYDNGLRYKDLTQHFGENI